MSLFLTVPSLFQKRTLKTLILTEVPSLWRFLPNHSHRTVSWKSNAAVLRQTCKRGSESLSVMLIRYQLWIHAYRCFLASWISICMMASKHRPTTVELPFLKFSSDRFSLGIGERLCRGFAPSSHLHALKLSCKLFCFVIHSIQICTASSNLAPPRM